MKQGMWGQPRVTGSTSDVHLLVGTEKSAKSTYSGGERSKALLGGQLRCFPAAGGPSGA